MNIRTKLTPMVVGAAAALLVLGTAATYPQVSQAATATPTPTQPATPGTTTPDTTTPDTQQGNRGWLNQGRGQMGVDHDQYLADALGITVEELQAARATAAGAAIDKLVENGTITQAQADTLKQRLENAAANGGMRLGGRGLGMLEGQGIDAEQLLADALDIDVAALQAAQQTAFKAMVDQAVTDGQITQDQADLALARQAFRQYWLSQQQSYADQVQAALDAGAITQAQADLLLANQPAGRGFGLGEGFGMGRGDFGGSGMGPGMGMPGMQQGGRGGHGGHGGRGGWGDQDGMNGQNGQNGDSQSNNPQGTAPSDSLGL